MKNIMQLLYVSVALTFISHLAYGGERKTVYFKSAIRASESSASTLPGAIFLDHLKISKVDLENRDYNKTTFTKILSSELDFERTVGKPQIPVKSYLLSARPADISVAVTVLTSEKLPDLKPWPVQEEDCRCETKIKKDFSYDSSAYSELATATTETSRTNIYRLSYLGEFRGIPITRLDVSLASYNSAENSLTVHTAVQVEASAKEFQLPRTEYKDYLFVIPASTLLDLTAFKAWKESRGYKIHIMKIEPNEMNTTAIAAKIKQQYISLGIDFVLLVGDEKKIPMFYVDTSGSIKTPSDLNYFTMDGANDSIPDVFYSRLASPDPAAQLQKAIDFESGRGAAAGGFGRVIGVASNEGADPSDSEYVKSIEQKFSAVLGSQGKHFDQDDNNSNPNNLNAEFNSGAFWLTYMGHGSGTSWPSMNKEYLSSHIPLIKNKEAVKPVVVDVACQNGRLQSGYLGMTFSSVQPKGEQAAYGAVAYYGGTVNISWHPPAIMAQGIAFEHLDKNFKHLGEALLAGQLYLSTHWSETKGFIDNLEWYHLQGDPGMDIGF